MESLPNSGLETRSALWDSHLVRGTIVCSPFFLILTQFLRGFVNNPIVTMVVGFQPDISRSPFSLTETLTQLNLLLTKPYIFSLMELKIIFFSSLHVEEMNWKIREHRMRFRIYYHGLSQASSSHIMLCWNSLPHITDGNYVGLMFSVSTESRSTSPSRSSHSTLNTLEFEKVPHSWTVFIRYINRFLRL